MFSREDVINKDSGPSQTLVKVTNTKLGVSTFWTMGKFEVRLVRMRELYQVVVVVYSVNTIDDNSKYCGLCSTGISRMKKVIIQYT